MKNITCLLIDDDAEDHELFHDVIKTISDSIKCIFSFNGKEAIEKLLCTQFKPDLIFLDLKMPFMNGIQFLTERLKHSSIKNIPVYILTDYSYDSITEAFTLGARDIIAKPFSLLEWEHCLKKIVFEAGSDGLKVMLDK